MNKRYRHLYFDLDRTLWDFEANSQEAFNELFIEYKLDRYFPDAKVLFNSYNKHNEAMWELYRQGKVKKDFLRIERFMLTLKDFGVTDVELAGKMSDRYLHLAPRNKHLVQGCLETLDYLVDKYQLYILTNGFKEIQKIKMEYSGLKPYFNKVITSDEACSQKPNSRIFEYALNCVNAKKQESLMIGDDIKVDILGAKKFGIDQIFVNYNRITHEHKISYEVFSFDKIKEFL